MYGQETDENFMTDIDSFVEIELYQDAPFECGGPLYGTVHVHARENLQDLEQLAEGKPGSLQVALTFQGEEQVVLQGSESGPRAHPIIKERIVLFDYAQYENVILQGQYSYPFTVNLPSWLPQSHLCFSAADPKKPGPLNTFKIKYNLIASIELAVPDEKTQKTTYKLIEAPKSGGAPEERQKLVHVRRITVVTPQFSEPLLNQEIKVSSKIKSMGLLGSGQCTYTCQFERDVLFPKDTIRLRVDVDNSQCSKKIDKYKIKLLRRTQAFNVETSKPIYANDVILVSDKIESTCEAKMKEVKKLEFQIPSTLFFNPEDEKKCKIPLVEKPLAQGPSSSISARLFKVQYVLQFSLKHHIVGASSKTMPEAQIPVMIMTPNHSCIMAEKPKIQQHPNWQPYAFDFVEFTLAPEKEEANEYAKYRKWLIEKEKEFVEQQKDKIGRTSTITEEVKVEELTQKQDFGEFKEQKKEEGAEGGERAEGTEQQADLQQQPEGEQQNWDNQQWFQGEDGQYYYQAEDGQYYNYDGQPYNYDYNYDYYDQGQPTEGATADDGATATQEGAKKVDSKPAQDEGEQQDKAQDEKPEEKPSEKKTE